MFGQNSNRWWLRKQWMSGCFLPSKIQSNWKVVVEAQKTLHELSGYSVRCRLDAEQVFWSPEQMRASWTVGAPDPCKPECLQAVAQMGSRRTHFPAGASWHYNLPSYQVYPTSLLTNVCWSLVLSLFMWLCNGLPHFRAHIRLAHFAFRSEHIYPASDIYGYTTAPVTRGHTKTLEVDAFLCAFRAKLEILTQWKVNNTLSQVLWANKQIIWRNTASIFGLWSWKSAVLLVGSERRAFPVLSLITF